MFLLYGIFFLFLICICADYWRKRRFMFKYGSADFVPYLPLIGSSYIPLRVGFWNSIKYILETQTCCLAWIVNRPIYYTKKAEDVQAIFSSKTTLKKSVFYNLIEFIKGSLLGCDVETWKTNRRLLNKCFNPKQMLDFVQIFNELADTLTDQICQEMTSRYFNRVANRTFLNDFYATLGNFGTKDFTSLLETDISSTGFKSMKKAIKRYFNPLLYSDFIYYKTEDGKKYKKMADGLETMLIELSKKHQENNCENELDSSMKSGFIDILLNKYELEQRKHEMTLFTLGSSETTGTAFTAIILLLGMFPSVQEKLYQEIQTVIGNDDNVQTYHILQLKYMQMVINESLRLFPPGCFIGRHTTTDLDLGNNKILSKGTDIVVGVLYLHRDSKIWKDPLEFIPERFLPEEVEKRHPTSFIPFSYGLRNCIGAKYAEIVLKINLVKLVRKYLIFSDCKSVADIDITICPLLEMPGHHKLRFKKRPIENL